MIKETIIFLPFRYPGIGCIVDISNSKLNVVVVIFVNVAFEQRLTLNNNNSANVDALKSSMPTNKQP